MTLLRINGSLLFNSTCCNSEVNYEEFNAQKNLKSNKNQI